MIDVHYGDNLTILASMATESFDLIYIDPPFNTGRVQSRTRIKTTRSASGDRTGFGGRRYETIKIGTKSFDDNFFGKYIDFIYPRLAEAYRVLRRKGSLFLHIDSRESHYCKIVLDDIFGRTSFMNEIVWAYDYGARSKTKWPAKHDVIFWYASDPLNYTFRYEAIDRIPYMAPGLVTKEKAARGKTPTDVWWQTIVPTNSKERTGYPTQKPLAILKRIVDVHTFPGGRVLDFFAGSGTTGEAAALLGRDAVLVDESPEAIRVMKRRFKSIRGVTFWPRKK
jgi:site-specific DNA-methyltransferase (adenine-specific)